jgi:hypothetical protein
MTSVLARVFRSILASYIKGITFNNEQTDYFEQSWSDLKPEIKTQYLLMVDQIIEKLPSLGRKKK